jgi:hypothetical protein
MLSRNVRIETYRTVNLPVLCECETWSPTLREGHRLRVFENRVVKIFEQDEGSDKREKIEYA